MKRFLFLICLFAGSILVNAQTPSSPNHGLTITSGSAPGVFSIQWWGTFGNSYFIQTCDDLATGVWTYVPISELGANQPISWGFTSTSTKFFLRLKIDSDGQLLPDDWQMQYFGTTGVDPNALAPGGSWLTNLQSFQQGSNPTAPELVKISGDNQIGGLNVFLVNPLVVNITGTNDINLPVTFTVNSGGGQVALSNQNGTQAASSVTAYTDNTGSARAYLLMPASNAATVSVSASSGTFQAVVFSARTDSTLAGYWAFEEGTGTIAHDSTGNGNNGTLSNGVLWGTGFDGKTAIQFPDGQIPAEGQTLTIPNPTGQLIPAANGPFTIAFWFRQDFLAQGYYQSLFLNYDETGETGFWCGTVSQTGSNGSANTNILDFGGYGLSGSGSTDGDLYSQTQIYPDVWYHVAIAYSGTGVKMYVNGNLEASGSGTYVPNTENLIAGTDFVFESEGYGVPYGGKLDDLRIYRRELPQTEILSLYNQDADPNGLPYWWKLYYFGTPFISGSDAAPRGGGLTILQAFQQGVNPIYADSIVPAFQIGSGNGQNGAANCFLAYPLVVQASGSNIITGTVASLPSAPVAFSIAAGCGRLSTSTGSQSGMVSSTNCLTVASDTNGNATVYFMPTGTGTTACQINASLLGASPVTFTATRNPLVGNWNFNEGTGTIAYDSSNTGNNAQLCAGASWSTAFDGSGAVSLDGGQYVFIPNPTNRVIPASGGGPFTVSFWMVQYSAVSGTMAALMSNDNNQTSGFRCGIDYGFYDTTNGGTNRLKFWSDQSQGTFDMDTTDPIVPGQLYNVALVYSGSDAKIYLNGKLEATGSGFLLSNTNALLAGNSIGGYSSFNGVISGLQVYQKQLSALDVLGIYNYASNNDGLPDWWKEQYFGTLNVDPNTLSPSGTGLTNLQSFNQGVSPADFYNGAAPSISMQSGNGQAGNPGSQLASALVVLVTNSNSNPLVNAPVTFFVTSGGGGLSLPGQSGPVTRISARTDSNGLATVQFTLPNTPGATSQIVAGAGTYSNSTATFTETTNNATGGGGGGGGGGGTPPAIQNITTTVNSDGSVDVSWTNTSTNGNNITLSIRQSDGSWQTVGSVPANATSYHIPPAQ